jgi:hypothetical protein
MSRFSEVTLTFDEIEPVIAGHAVVLGFLSGEVIYRDDDGVPFVVAMYVERADRCGKVEITSEHGALYESMKALFESDSWSDKAADQFRLNSYEAAWGRADDAYDRARDARMEAM